MARAKNTIRSEARRRTRENARAELATDSAGEEPSADSTDSAQPARRRSGLLFAWPDVRGDFRALPEMFRTRRLLWLPFVLLLVGFILALIYSAVPVDFQPLVALYFEWFFNPLALFTYFIAGFLAPRGSYLVGGIVGLVTGILITALVVIGQTAGFSSTVLTPSDLALSAVGWLFQTTVLGALAGGFAGWYRDFLRNMQVRGNQRRIEREAAEREKRRGERQEARKLAKQRP